jgi:putative membrane protein
MMIFSLILALLFAVIAVIFALGNTAVVTVSFLSWSVEGSLALVLLASVAIGILIGVLLMTPGTIKRNLALSGEKKKLKTAEKELDQRKLELDEHKSKVTELEGKVKETEAQQAQVADEINQRLDTL